LSKGGIYLENFDKAAPLAYRRTLS